LYRIEPRLSRAPPGDSGLPPACADLVAGAFFVGWSVVRLQAARTEAWLEWCGCFIGGLVVAVSWSLYGVT